MNKTYSKHVENYAWKNTILGLTLLYRQHVGLVLV